MRGDGDMPARIAQGSKAGVWGARRQECAPALQSRAERQVTPQQLAERVAAVCCETCRGQREVWMAGATGGYVAPCPSCVHACDACPMDETCPPCMMQTIKVTGRRAGPVGSRSCTCNAPENCHHDPRCERLVHPLASIGDPPEHRDYIAGKVDALDPGVELGASVVVSAFVTVDRGIEQPTRIGDRTLLMKGVHVAHDCQVGADVEIGANAVLCGHVRVGDGAQIHGLAFVRPFISVGAGARVGGGAVVTKDVPAGEVWAGNPARPLTRGRVAAERGQTSDPADANMSAEEYAEKYGDLVLAAWRGNPA